MEKFWTEVSEHEPTPHEQALQDFLDRGLGGTGIEEHQEFVPPPIVAVSPQSPPAVTPKLARASTGQTHQAASTFDSMGTSGGTRARAASARQRRLKATKTLPAKGQGPKLWVRSARGTAQDNGEEVDPYWIEYNAVKRDEEYFRRLQQPARQRPQQLRYNVRDDAAWKQDETKRVPRPFSEYEKEAPLLLQAQAARKKEVYKPVLETARPKPHHLLASGQAETRGSSPPDHADDYFKWLDTTGQTRAKTSGWIGSSQYRQVRGW